MLLSEKYQKFFKDGQAVSPTWAFCLTTVVEVLQEIAKDMGLIRPSKGLIRPLKGLIRPLKGLIRLPTTLNKAP